MNVFKQGPNPFGLPGMSWGRAARRAGGVQFVLMLITVGIGITSVGADNPLPFLAGFVLQFPASMLFSPLVGLLHGVTSDTTAMAVAAAIVIGVQCIVLTALFKRRWR